MYCTSKVFKKYFVEKKKNCSNKTKYKSTGFINT